MSVSFVDTHAHLPMLSHAPLDQILARAQAAGLARMITVSTDESNWDPNRELAEKHSHLFYTLGLHPHDAKKWKEVGPRLEARFAPKNGNIKVPPRCVAIGEMGMDFHYNFSDKDAQIECFEGQLALAKRVNLPTVIHSRNAFPDLFASIRKIGTAAKPGVMHCFTGTAEEARQSLDLGFMISFSGILTFRTAADLREAAKIIPADRLLIETDCPYLAPIPHRGKPNEPSYIPHTAHTLAAARGVPVEEIALQTTRNAIEFFGL